MNNPIPIPEIELLRMSGVSLIRQGPSGKKITRYRVVERDHVARFSHFSCLHPLAEAVKFFLDRANANYYRQAAIAD